MRLRRTVAAVTGSEPDDVLVAGHADACFHHVATPEEYDAQHYEGGSTLFGRRRLPALRQTADRPARALRDGTELPAGTPPPDLSGAALSPQPPVVLDVPAAAAPGRYHGDARILLGGVRAFSGTTRPFTVVG
ncbi:neutral/alkaline non-lysosomal ceramidase N-terminal domain-containing protein [Streptomyces carminius]|uniref:neutral/alkaline non-lysosomal ceramidase N-terminal domain-containing protein n=1 Tax=Streptomyces carminius TaxID=2665496 RepID=UPI001E3D58F5|nr:neutral/alkaline non-lysosomal ceramidase N-terminal domain-containing protein [Streptomyces carminius]